MDKNKITTVDKSNMLRLLLSFPEQVIKARQIGEQGVKKIRRYNDSKISNIIFAGMGGSAIAGDVVIACLEDEVSIPLSITRDYFLPHFVDETSLIFILSYSGDTEESLSAYQDAVNRKAQIICVTSGGTLADWARRDNFPLFVIPAGQPPRTAIGYLSIPLFIALSHLGIIANKTKELSETQRLLQLKSQLYRPDNNFNLAEEISQKIQEKIPVIYSAVGLTQVAAMRWKCQFSENAKILAFYNSFPELNHNEIVGWEMLKDIFKHFQIIILRDKDDYYRTQKRMEITKEILAQESISTIELESEGESKLARLFSLIYLGDVISFYLAVNYGVDPTSIKKIQILKDKLKMI